MSDLVRLSCNMNLETAQALQRIKDRLPEESASYTEAVRRAIALATYIYDEESSGRRIVTENMDGTERHELLVF